MRCVVQRVSRAAVTVADKTVGSIGKGLLVLVGVQQGDELEDARYCAEKVAGLRVFEDENDKMNLSVQDVGGSVLAVSQFTLCGDARHGRRPSFSAAESPRRAEMLCEVFVDTLWKTGLRVETGVFQTHMEVSLVNDGPVTILLDSRKTF